MEQIKKAFDAIATEYDSLREFVIPDLQQFYTTAVWAAESSAPEPSILDIGAGTGLLSALILQKFPGAQMTLLDISENMLDIARRRFAGRKNITYIVSDYRQGIPDRSVRSGLFGTLHPSSHFGGQTISFRENFFCTET